MPRLGVTDAKNINFGPAQATDSASVTPRFVGLGQGFLIITI
jgi:hypothetical protein